MKKLLAVILTVLTLFSVLGVGASAQSNVGGYWGTYADKNSQTILVFYPNGGTFKSVVEVYDANSRQFVETLNYAGTYTMIPKDYRPMTAGSMVTMPDLAAPSGYAFSGWQCVQTREFFVAGPNSFEVKAEHIGQILTFQPILVASAPEEDTFGTILNLLVKVFGTIAGIVIFGGDPEAGVDLFNKLFSALDF